MITTLNKTCYRTLALKKMRIIDELLLHSKNSMFGISIRTSIYAKTPVNEILKFIKESARDNRNMVIDCIGYNLLEEITSL